MVLMIFASTGVCIYPLYLPATQVLTANQAASHAHFSPSRAEEGPSELCIISIVFIDNEYSEYGNDVFG